MKLRIGIIFFFSVSLVLAQPDRPGSGRSLEFGNGKYADLGNAYSNISLPISIAFWFKPVSNAPTYRIFFSNRSTPSSPNYKGLMVYFYGNNFIVNIGDGTGRAPSSRRSGSTPINLQLNQWYHLTLICVSASDIRFYVNGEQVITNYGGTGSTTMYKDNTESYIGSGAGGPSYDFLDAELDEFSIWNKALSTTEIRDLMCRKLSGSESQLLGYYTFDEGSGNILNDKSPNNNHGTLIGSPAWKYSGAPVGDYSEYFYIPNPSFYHPLMMPLDSIVFRSFGGNLSGAHFYRVDSIPDQRGNLHLIPGYNYYWGMYVFGSGNMDYDLNFYYNYSTINTYNPYLSLKYRSDNSVASWSSTNKQANPRQIHIGNHIGRAEWCPSLDTCYLPPFDLGRDTMICDLDSMEIGVSPQAGYTYTWNTGETTSKIFAKTYGVYWLRVMDQNNCTNTDSLSISSGTSGVNSFPKDTSACDSLRLLLPATYTNILWSNGTTDREIVITESDTYWVTATSASGCMLSDTVIVEVSPSPELDLDDTVKSCDPTASIQALNPDIDKYLWSDGSTGSSLITGAPGTYWLKATFSSGCIAYDTTEVRFYPQRDLLDEFYNICSGSSVTLTLETDLNNPLWSTGHTGLTEEFSDTGTYWVQAEVPEGCIATDTFKIVNDLSFLLDDIISDTTFCIDEPMILNVEIPGIKTIWPDGSRQNYFVRKPGWVRVVLDDGCNELVHFIEVKGKTCPCQIHLPNAFSPNADLLNDVFVVHARCEFEYFDFKIFNRWGTLVFQAVDPNEHWDGSFNERTEGGVYTFTLTYVTAEGDEGVRNGYITLIR